jgi:hypothetical protein
MMDTFPQLLEQAANGRDDALSFLRYYMELGHRIDDIIDKPDTTNEEVLQTFMLALTLFSINRFYQEHREQLFPLIAASLNSYATSVAWEQSDKDHQRKLSDVLRSDGVQVIEYVAFICGGIERMRVLSPLLRENSWHTHHSGNNPT